MINYAGERDENMINYNFLIETNDERTIYSNAVFTSGDLQAYRMNFTFKENGKTMDIDGFNLIVKAKRSDGAVYSDMGITDGQKAYFDVKNSMISLQGEISFEIALAKDDSTYVTTKEIFANVREGYGEANITSEDKTPVLSSILGIASDAKAYAKEAEEAAEGAKAYADSLHSETISYANNNFANAFKGSASGAVVSIDDIGPIEHDVGVKVSSKNLWDNNSTTKGVGTWTTTQTGASFIRNEGYTGGSYIYSPMVFIKKGTTITFSCSKSGGGSLFLYKDKIYGKKLKSTSDGLLSYTATEDTSVLPAIVINSVDNEVVITDIQFEIGTVATAYTPYVDVSTAILSVQGKNLLKYPYHSKTHTTNGITFTDNGDGTVTVDGTATDDAIFYCAASSLYLPKGTYTISGAANDGETYMNVSNSSVILGERTINWQGGRFALHIVVAAGKTVENELIKPQIEVGSIATSYEPYKSASYPVEADGSTEGVKSIYPNMTITTDTEGVVVDCEYNRDSNKALEKITNAIISLGGNI